MILKQFIFAAQNSKEGHVTYIGVFPGPIHMVVDLNRGWRGGLRVVERDTFGRLLLSRRAVAVAEHTAGLVLHHRERRATLGRGWRGHGGGG